MSNKTRFKRIEWQATQLEARRELARQHLTDFCGFIDPKAAADYSAPHLVRMANELERVERGEIDRLFITCPPRHWKSSLGSEKFPIWCLGRNPLRSIILVSHGASLSLGFSRNIRDCLAANPNFRQCFPEARVNTDFSAVQDWALVGAHRSSVRALGVNAGVTGRGADCVLPDTLIMTDTGEIQIKDIEVCTRAIKILGYDEQNKCPVWKRAKAIAHRKANGFYRITTTSGRVVEATAEHPFFDGDKYIPASELATGDCLLRLVRQEDNQVSVRDEQIKEERTCQSLLFNQMSLCGQKQKATKTLLQGMRKRFSSWTKILLRQLQGCVFQSENDGEKSEGFEAMPSMWRDVQASPQSRSMLQSEMRRKAPFQEDECREQSWLQGWNKQNDGETEAAYQNEADSSEAGQSRVRCLRSASETSHSSHQFECSGQPLRKPCDVMQALPRNASRCGAFKTEEDFVALVEFIRKPTTVWNLQVEGVENFFANGILTHNCIIIDDPIADDKEAFSKTKRDAVWQWYRETLRDRLNPGGAIVLIMSRWHVDDLAGMLLKASKSGDGEQWHQLHMPAIDEAGGALWPDKYPVEELSKIKKAIGTRAFAARFQGSPKLSEGQILDSTKLVMVNAEDVPEMIRVVRRWDLAFSDAKGADYLAGCKMGKAKNGDRYILHMRRVHGRWTVGKPAIMRQAEQDGKSVEVAIEANGTQLGYYDDIKADERMKGYVVHPDKPESNKEVRASVWGTRLDDGIIKCVRADWNGDFFDEMDYFPNSDHDDQVDAVSGAWRILGDAGGAVSAASDIAGGEVRPGIRTFRPRSLIVPANG